MTAVAGSGLRTLAFGDLDTGVWGAAWVPGQGSATFAAVGARGAAAPLSASLAGAADSEEWRLRGDRAELIVSPDGEPVAVAAPAAGLEGFEQLCRVSGRFALGGAEQPVECLGRRGARTRAIDLDVLESIREVSAWFGPGEGLAVMALRPRGSRGHESDVLTAAVFEPGAAGSVTEPRLSTTYSASGRPARVGLELWLRGEGDEEQYPRRAAGEATGALVESSMDDFQTGAELFRLHNRGRVGAGVYLVARHR